MQRFYRKLSEGSEICFYVETASPFTREETQILRWLLAETFAPEQFGDTSFLKGGAQGVVEIGPRLNFETAFSTNAVAVCHAIGLTKVTRLERSRRYQAPEHEQVPQFIQEHCDKMTECPYPTPLDTFATGMKPEAVYTIPLQEEGPGALLKIPGLAMDEWDRNFYYQYFVKKEGRNPTIVEILDLNNANSEHSRHGYFKGKQIIDGAVMPETLMEIVKSTLAAQGSNSVKAFSDNSSAIRGYAINTIVPERPGVCSPFHADKRVYHILFTAETHNFPSGVAPFPGAETGTGGRIRDVQAMGRGGLVIAGTAGYCVGNLQIPGYALPWEDASFEYPKSLARPLKIEIDASNGASDYGNKFGEADIQGFTRSFGLRLPHGERREWLKPIMFTGGIGQIDDRHLVKGEAQQGMFIVQVGGPAYRIGMGGGAASSLIQGENKEELDFNAVQRGDAEMEQKMNRVIRACVEMGDDNPVVSVHDQGAGGPANVLKELVEKAGGKIEIRKITVGDPTLSVLEIWVAEYQERNGFLIKPDRLPEFQSICQREKVNCEVLGEVTGDGIFVVHDEKDDSTPVHLHLQDVLGNIPQKEFQSQRTPQVLEPLALPKNLSVKDALDRVLRLVSVGSKQFLTNKVDRSVTGLIARQQCCGPLQLTVADVALVAQSHFGLTGAAFAIGEQPIKMLVSPSAGARMAVAEMLTNIVWAKVSALDDIKCSANWMWAPKLPGEGAQLYDAACAMRDFMVALGIAVDGGKDSLSMATKVPLPGGTTEIVKSPGELVVSGYVTVPDVTKVVTPDLKRPGKSKLLWIDFSGGHARLGGSALAHGYSQIGDQSPDVDDAELLKRGFQCIQRMIGENLILAGHDISDGGIIVTLLEMGFSGNCGIHIDIASAHEALPTLFAEESGLVIEYNPTHEDQLRAALTDARIPHQVIGSTSKEMSITVKVNGLPVLTERMPMLRAMWQETSYQLDRLQANPQCVDEEKKNCFDRKGPTYQLTFTPEPTPPLLLTQPRKPMVAIIREEGSNGDREMTSAFFSAGFEPWDVTMTDLLKGSITLDKFRGIVFVGGFSYADVLDSAKGWAGVIRFNSKLKSMFDVFLERDDTFSLSICNGCQLAALLGWVPWRGLPETQQPRFIRNRSGRFEPRWTTIKVNESPAVMLRGMQGSAFGVWVAHGEGRMLFPDQAILSSVKEKHLIPITFVDDAGNATEQYPFNPNGSVEGIAGLCSPDGRHLALMPHPERSFLKWQWAWMPEHLQKELAVSTWLRLFQNARAWCDEI